MHKGVSSLPSVPRESLDERTLSWRILRALRRDSRASLTAGELRDIERVLTKLFQRVRDAGLSYVPVFGYLSLMTDNAYELGKSRQENVLPGRDIVPARLEGYEIAPVATTVTRGTPTHPGVVAGLSPKQGRNVLGVMLKIPLSRAALLLPRLLKRELSVENDLRMSDSRTSAWMYRAQVLPVELENGQHIPCLVFTTNPDSPKALLEQRVFADTDNPSGQWPAGALAWAMAAQAHDGRLARDYWSAYISLCRSKAFPVADWVLAAVAQSARVPNESESARLAAQAMVDSEARAQLDERLAAMSGAVLPVEPYRLQRSASSAKK